MYTGHETLKKIFKFLLDAADKFVLEIKQFPVVACLFSRNLEILRPLRAGRRR
jgi:hypothetical protein